MTADHVSQKLTSDIPWLKVPMFVTSGTYTYCVTILGYLELVEPIKLL